MKVFKEGIMPAPGSESIFVCYRRSDSADTVDRIYEVLKKDFAHQRPFRDIDSIPVGIDFSNHIMRALDACSVVLVVIGPGWLDAQSEDRRRRLDDPGDHVRVEIETALRVEDLRVIPVFIRNATMPGREHLPDSIRGLVARGGLSIRPDPDFRGDMSRLIMSLRNGIAEVRQVRLQRQRQNKNEQRKQNKNKSPEREIPQPRQKELSNFTAKVVMLRLASVCCFILGFVVCMFVFLAGQPGAGAWPLLSIIPGSLLIVAGCSVWKSTR